MSSFAACAKFSSVHTLEERLSSPLDSQTDGLAAFVSSSSPHESSFRFRRRLRVHRKLNYAAPAASSEQQGFSVGFLDARDAVEQQLVRGMNLGDGPGMQKGRQEVGAAQSTKHYATFDV